MLDRVLCSSQTRGGTEVEAPRQLATRQMFSRDWDVNWEAVSARTTRLLFMGYGRQTMPTRTHSAGVRPVVTSPTAHNVAYVYDTTV